MSCISITEEVTCGKCGQKVTHGKDWLTDDDHNVICNTCYLNAVFPEIKECFKKIFDKGPLPSEI